MGDAGQVGGPGPLRIKRISEIPLTFFNKDIFKY
jgi:hypothetical protein